MLRHGHASARGGEGGEGRGEGSDAGGVFPPANQGIVTQFQLDCPSDPCPLVRLLAFHTSQTSFTLETR